MAFFKNRLRIGMVVAAAVIIPAGLWASLGHPGLGDDQPMKLVVSLSARSLKVVEDGEVVRTYGIAIGRPSHPTPRGRFRTGDIDWNPSWTPPPREWAKNKTYQPPGAAANPMQGVKIYFNPPYYFIHGTNDPGSIGEAASHGCIRMTEDDAVSLARRIQEAGGSVSLVIDD
jgi:lipoprotein-anchoring transpeptidase ErfK/SrfK